MQELRHDQEGQRRRLEPPGRDATVHPAARAAVTSPRQTVTRAHARGTTSLTVATALIALAAVLLAPLRADAQTAGSAWGQAASDAQNTNRAVEPGPSDPGLRWLVDLESLVTEEAPQGYAGGGLSAAHSPIIGASGEVIVPVTNPGIGGRPGLVALDPDSGEVAWEIQRRLASCAPAVDSQGRVWTGLRFDYDDRSSTSTLRAFGADGAELEDSLFELTDLGVANPERWCAFNTGLHIAGDDANERLVLFHVLNEPLTDIAVLDISGDSPTIAWQRNVETDELPFDGFTNAALGGPGGGPQARLAALTDDQIIIPVTTDDRHQLAFLSLASGEVERLVDLPVRDLEGNERDAPRRDGVNVTVTGGHAIVALAERGDYLGQLHGIALDSTATTPDWTAPLPSDSRSISGGQVMAVSGPNIVVPSLGRLQAHNAGTGAATSWSDEPETMVNSAQVIADADGAIFTTYRPAAGAANVVRYRPDGRMDWQLRRTTLLGELDLPPDAPDELRVGPIDGDGTLYVRMGSLLYALDDSGGLADCVIPFEDVAETNTHAENICRLVQLEITGGTSDTTYSPRQDVNRAQMASFLARALGLAPITDPGVDAFPDVNPGNVHAGNINAIRAAGITQGLADGTYNPAGPVTRAQMASFLANAAELDPVEGGSGFTDVDPNNVHTPRIYAVRDAGITAGRTDTTFEPNTEVRRDQMASFIIRLVDYLDDQG